MELTLLQAGCAGQSDQAGPHLSDSLRKDHRRMREELTVLKNAEGGDSAHLSQTLRDVCARLSDGLRAHMRSEEELPVPRNRSLGAAAMDMSTQPFTDHYSDYRYLQVIARCIASETPPHLLNSRYQLLTKFVSELDRHIQEQEAGWNK